MSGVSRARVIEIREASAAALNNEMVTRGRVEALETRAAMMDAKGWRGFWERLKWLLLGR